MIRRNWSPVSIADENELAIFPRIFEKASRQLMGDGKGAYHDIFYWQLFLERSASHLGS